VVIPSGDLSVGVLAPTARLQLPAGTAGAGTSPLKMTSGTLLTTPEAGAVEYDGTSLYYTDGTGARHTLSGSSQWTTSGSNIYYNTAGGNVGIGTTTPGAALQIKAGTTTVAPLMLRFGQCAQNASDDELGHRPELLSGRYDERSRDRADSL
jgi:hypothetical protein